MCMMCVFSSSNRKTNQLENKINKEKNRNSAKSAQYVCGSGEDGDVLYISTVYTTHIDVQKKNIKIKQNNKYVYKCVE